MTTETLPFLICEINVRPSKASALVPTRWLVQQCIPYPDFGPDRQWRNADTLLQRYGNPPQIPAPSYRAFLLAEGVAPPALYNRTHFAGYTHRPDRSGAAVTLPGTFEFRGKSLGEISITFSMATRYPEQNILVRDHSTPTPGEKDFLVEQVVIPLADFALKYREELAELAAEKFRKDCEEHVARARADIAAAEAQIPGMTSLLRASATKLPVGNPHRVTKP